MHNKQEFLLPYEFLEIERSLDGVTSKLDAGFSQKFAAYGFQGQVAGSVSPQLLMHKVSRVEKNVVLLLEELHAVEEEEKAAVEFLKQAVASSFETLMSTSYQAPFEKPASLKLVESLLGIKLQEPDIEYQPAIDKVSSAPCDEEDSLTEDQVDYIQAVSQARELQDKDCQKAAMPSNACRHYTNTLVEIDEAEYSTLSDFTRQRVKLAEVNMVYKQLWRHFKEERNTLPLSTSEMFRKGIRITGRTGQTKLKILQALKLISLSSKGDVKLL